MRRVKDISVIVNYPKDEEELKQLEEKKAKITIKILKDKYGDMVLDKYVNSIRNKKK